MAARDSAEKGPTSPVRPTAPATRGAVRLSRTLVVDVAVTLADAEGVAAASMGRLGRELGVTPMSLYRYVDGKQDLQAAMAERVLDDLDLPEQAPPDADWAAAARRVVDSWARLVALHPGAVRLLYTARPATRKDMLPAEHFGAAALAAGFTPAQAATAYRAIVLFVDSVLMTTSLGAGSGHSSWRSLPASLTESLPAVRRLTPYVDRLTHREVFDAGVDILIAGIEAGLRP